MKKTIKILSIGAAFLAALVFSLTLWGAHCLPDEYSETRAAALGPLFSLKQSGALRASGGESAETDTQLRLLHAVPVKTVRFAPSGVRRVVVGGELIGLRLHTRGVLVVGVERFEGETGEVSPAAQAGVCEGDLLLELDGAPIADNAALTRAIEQSGGRPLALTLERDGKPLSLTLTPQKTAATGAYKGGLWIRDAAAGIGTLTFTDPETGVFAALGHGIYDGDAAVLLPAGGGELTDAALLSVRKGAVGAAGEISGQLLPNARGSVALNTEQGVYGKAYAAVSGETTEVAPAKEVRIGPAQILCTVAAGGKQYYDAEITKLGGSRDPNKSLTLTVTDERLLALTGGIVQGMSGSPILQDGKLVGAVTHVFVNDPKTGYGIFAETMLQNTQTVRDRAAEKAAS